MRDQYIPPKKHEMNILYFQLKELHKFNFISFPIENSPPQPIPIPNPTSAHSLGDKAKKRKPKQSKARHSNAKQSNRSGQHRTISDISKYWRKQQDDKGVGMLRGTA